MLEGHVALTERIIKAAIEVHRTTGPGLLESIYEAGLAFELQAAGVCCRRQVEVPVYYKRLKTTASFRADFIVEDAVLVELKAVERLLDVHKAQVLTYLRLTGLEVGLLINFNVPVLRSGVRRLVRSSAPPRLL